MTVTASTSTAPMAEASTTRPLRILYMYRPISSAIGTVHAMVKVPQELPGTACVTPSGSVIARSAPGRSGESPPDGMSSVRPRATVNDSPRVIDEPLG